LSITQNKIAPTTTIINIPITSVSTTTSHHLRRNFRKPCKRRMLQLQDSTVFPTLPTSTQSETDPH
jgi:hypothetical protein